MSSLMLPELYYPFPPLINLHVDAVHKHSLQWIERFGLIASEAGWRRFRAARFAWLAARIFPTAPLDELKLVADWNAWLFLYDDQCDEVGLGRQPAALAELCAQLRAIAGGAVPPAGSQRLAFALHDLIGRMHARADVAWRERFACSVGDYFDACIWEARNRAIGRVPDLATYVQMRPFTGALNIEIELIELCEHIHLPAEVYAHPDVQRLTLMASNVVCWANDIISLEKELEHGDVHNLVIALQHEYGCTLQQAIDQARAMHDDEVQAFVGLVAHPPRLGARLQAELERYIAILRAWMRGNVDWAYDTERYGMAARAAAA